MFVDKDSPVIKAAASPASSQSQLFFVLRHENCIQVQFIVSLQKIRLRGHYPLLPQRRRGQSGVHCASVVLLHIWI